MPADLGERVAVVETRQDTLEKSVEELTTIVRRLVEALSSLKGAAWLVTIMWPVVITGAMIAIRLWK